MSVPVHLRRAAVVVGVLALAAVGTACGDDDSNATSAQGLVARQYIDRMAENGIDVDESCVRSTTDKLGEFDAGKILIGGEDISPGARQVLFELRECVDVDSLND